MVARIDLELPDDELLARGIAAARVGESGEAAAYLEALIERDPEQAEAWLWLASVTDEPKRKRERFQRVLELRPEDAEAQAGLDRLVEKYGAGVLADDAPAESLRCTWHPDTETLLRCQRCGRPMCPRCARQHPVGMRCKECMKELRSPVYQLDAAAALRGLALGSLAAVLASLVVGLAIRYLFIGLILAYLAGDRVADATSRGSGNKRGRGVAIVTSLALLLGAALAQGIAGLLPVFGSLGTPNVVGSALLVLLGTAAAFRRLR